MEKEKVGKCLEMFRSHWAAGRYIGLGLDSDAKRVLAIMAASDPGLKKYLDFDPAKDSDNAKKQFQVAAAGTIMEFNRRIIEATHQRVCAYKPNIGFYEALGSWGMNTLDATIGYIRELAPAVPVILDWKRGDIGNTNEAYMAAFDLHQAHAMTANPYLGFEDSVEVFLRDPDKLVFILCRTSNAGARDLQDLICNVRMEGGAVMLGDVQVTTTALPVIEQMPLYQVVARLVNEQWNAEHNNCGLVMGATYVDELKDGRRIAPALPFLMPGGGAQKADIVTAVRSGIGRYGSMVVNFSREFLFACEKEGSEYGPAEFDQAALAALLREEQKIRSALVE